MTWRLGILVATITTILTLSVHGEPYYTIVAPTSFREKADYSMSFATTGLDVPMKVKITLSYGNFSQNQLVEVPPNNPTVTAMHIGALDQSQYYSYTLTVEGLAGIVFNESAPVYLHRKSSSAFFQTDKAKYKPGDKVQFRILVVDKDTKPLDLSKQTVRVWISNPRGHKIKEWNDVKITNGVFKGELKLSREPELGRWSLNINYNPEKNQYRSNWESEGFEVAEYVLPKYEITTSQPVYNTYSSGKLIFGVQAKYTYGKSVVGTVTVKVHNPYYWYSSDELDDHHRAQRNFFKTIPIDGQATVELDLEKDLRMNLSSPETYTTYKQFEITVLEELTGVSLASTVSIPIYVNDYKIDHIANGDNFKPGLLFGFFVKVTTPDDKPVVDTVNPVKVTVYYGFDDDQKTELTYHLDDQGMAYVSVTAPLSAKLLDFEINYKGEQDTYYLAPTKSESLAFIQANVLTKPLDIFKHIKVQIRATESIDYLHYQVISKDGIVVSQQVNPNAKIFTIKFRATFAMVPEASLIVYYYRPDGEIVSDRVTLKFENRLDNFVNVNLSANQLEPGDNVTITVDGRCNSYFGLLGVDQSVLLLKSGNDLSKEKVFMEMKNYEGNHKTYPEVKKISKRPYNVDYYAPYKTLTESGAIFFTNARKYSLSRSTNNLNSHRKHAYLHNRMPGVPVFDSAPMQASAFQSEGFGGGFGGAEPQPLKVRKDFPETWIWEDIDDNQCDAVKFTSKVPDTITSWVISAFALNKANGLGLGDTATLTLYKPFFVSTTLPYSVKRGEVLTLSIQIFNYLPKDQDVMVVMANEDQHFDFADDSSSPDKTRRENTLTVKSNSGSTMTFKVTPKKVGYVPIKITARCAMAGDAIEQLLLVESEGTPIHVNKAVLLDLRAENSKTIDFSIETPDVAVPDSTSAEVSVFGDILGSTIENLERLIRVPSGCGEQNMIAFVPNLLVLNYLKTVKQLTPAIRNRAIANMEIGYQRQLSYQRYEGSFSSFGTSDESGSSWLTAFVVRYFAEAKTYITIDDNVMTRGLDWLVEQQADNGRFIEPGRGAVSELESQASQGVGMTAHVLLAFLAQPNVTETHAKVIEKAAAYIVERVATIDHLYSLALAAYTLQRLGHASAPEVLTRLNKAATEENGLKWWKHKKTEEQKHWWYYESTTNIEITAIALATHAEAGLETEAFPILQWLIKQRNSRGGYYSTQDTILSIQAMAKMAARLYVRRTDLDVVVTFDPNGEYKVKIDQNNAIDQQNYELPLNTKSIKFQCQGKGFAVAQVAYKYYVIVPEPEPKFNLNVTLKDTNTTEQLELSICSSFVADEATNKSSMAIVEVAFPSGYTFDRDTLQRLRHSEDVSRVETKNLDTVVMVYFYSIGEREICLNVRALRTSKVALLKPAPVKVYDYYDSTKRARKFYDVNEVNVNA